MDETKSLVLNKIPPPIPEVYERRGIAKKAQRHKPPRKRSFQQSLFENMSHYKEQQEPARINQIEQRTHRIPLKQN